MLMWLLNLDFAASPSDAPEPPQGQGNILPWRRRRRS